MNTTKLKKTLEKRVNVVFDQFVDWFDVVGVLGLDVATRDFGSGSTCSLISESSFELDSHLRNNLLCGLVFVKVDSDPSNVITMEDTGTT
jgi:hypothetical protein